MISEYPVWEIVGPRINIPTETGGDERESGLVSALPLKADICSALADVRFVPIADIARLFLLLISPNDPLQRQTKR